VRDPAGCHCTRDADFAGSPRYGMDSCARETTR
jgi:hypothetical protein